MFYPICFLRNGKSLKSQAHPNGFSKPLATSALVNWSWLVWSFLIAALVNAPQAFARKTNFKESHSGIYTGAGTYFHFLANDNQFDPVPGTVPSTGTLAGSASTFLLPCRLGFFKDTPKGNIMIYGIYMLNIKSAWTVTGGPEGAGSTNFGSFGAGAEISLALMNDEDIRVNLALNGEYIRQKARLSFTATGGTTHDLLDLSVTSYLLGIGISPEIWLGDMYALSLFAGYQYGYGQSWNVAKDAAFMGNAYSVGPLTNPSSTFGVPAQFGGFYISGGLKLHFQ